MPESQDAYDDLLDRYGRLVNVDAANGLLRWDQQVAMPEGGFPARSEQQSALSTVHHDLLTDEAVAADLAALADADLDGDRRAAVRDIRRQHERAATVPDDLVETHARRSSEANETWQAAKAEDDFDAFAPVLDELTDLRRERAAHIDPDRPAFAVLFEDTEPHLPLSTVERVLETLKERIPPLVEEIREDGDDLPTPFRDAAPFDDDTQMALSEAALETVGYDFERGRLDQSAHPFTSGTQFDCRVTTRFREHDPLAGLMMTLHEFGHAQYNLSLPQEAYGTPLGQSASSGVHESQSRFWENHVGRTKAVFDLFLPTVKDHRPGTENVTVDEAHRAANRIEPSNLIRVEADELTYHMHIVVRFEVERALLAGDVDVADVPRLWNEKMEEYLGVVPDTDTDGCLQDIHWCSRFVSFQNYTVGSVLAAQLDAAMREDLDVDGLVREGEFGPLREWLADSVHRHGRRHPTDELVEVATGEPLTADYYLDYAESKFRDLYGL
jgi:carboxypeptidase Taq